jgi:hypothetical protein
MMFLFTGPKKAHSMIWFHETTVVAHGAMSGVVCVNILENCFDATATGTQKY